VTSVSNTQHINIFSRCDICKQHTTHQHHFTLWHLQAKHNASTSFLAVTSASNTQHIDIISHCDICKQHTTHQHHFTLWHL
jgi:predicted Zn-ribbon and HTH transcriptional regulator